MTTLLGKKRSATANVKSPNEATLDQVRRAIRLASYLNEPRPSAEIVDVQRHAAVGVLLH